MSYQTYNIQQTLSNTQAVEQLYQTQKQQPDTGQQKFAATIMQKAKAENQKTPEVSEAEQGKILKDKQDKLTLSFKKKKKKKQQDDEKKSKEEPSDTFESDVGQIIDISI